MQGYCARDGLGIIRISIQIKAKNPSNGISSKETTVFFFQLQKCPV
jgi:hypothetical protein